MPDTNDGMVPVGFRENGQWVGDKAPPKSQPRLREVLITLATLGMIGGAYVAAGRNPAVVGLIALGGGVVLVATWWPRKVAGATWTREQRELLDMLKLQASGNGPSPAGEMLRQGLAQLQTQIGSIPPGQRTAGAEALAKQVHAQRMEAAQAIAEQAANAKVAEVVAARKQLAEVLVAFAAGRAPGGKP